MGQRSAARGECEPGIRGWETAGAGKETTPMSVSTEWAWNDTAIVVTADGRVDGTNARDFQSALEAVIEASDQAVILDMERLTYISSAGLRVILLAAKSLQRKDAALSICSLSDPIREIFSVSGFDQIIPIHATQAEALAARKS